MLQVVIFRLISKKLQNVIDYSALNTTVQSGSYGPLNSEENIRLKSSLKTDGKPTTGANIMTITNTGVSKLEFILKFYP